MNLNWSRLFLISLIAGSGLLAESCQKKVIGPSETRDVLRTTVTITIYDQGYKAEDLKAIFDDLFGLMADWEKRALKPGTNNQVHNISSGAGEQSVTTDADVFQMLMKAIRFYDNSGKTFDIRYGPMLDAWGFDNRPQVPPSEQLDTLKSYVTDGGMFVAGNGILLAKSGMKFDAREIVEGYVFDLAASRLTEKGIHSATIHSKYVWRLIGDPPERRGFQVTFGHPVSSDSSWATVWSPAGGVAMAAVSKNHFEAEGKSYHSLLDPRTGKPADKLLGAIIQSVDAATAQAMAYAVFVHGTVDSLDSHGKESVGGSVIMSGTAASPQVEASGTLADKVKTGK